MSNLQKTPPALEVRNISVRFGGNEVLRELSLSVGSGECVGLIGPNGCGKSTLLNVMNGFVRPTTGSVSLHGAIISDLLPFQRARRGMGRVFQHSGIFRELTVRENILVASDAIGRTLTENEIGDALTAVNLATAVNQTAGDLSGGQQRLLELARTRIIAPSVLLLDEPTAGVAPKMRRDVLRCIAALKNEGCTVIVVEHDMQFVQELCSRVVMLYEGKVALDGAPADVRASSLLREVYLGAP